MTDAAAPRRATIRDVARFAGVSKRAVTRVTRGIPEVRPETEARIQAAIASLGYAPDPQAQALALGRSRLIGMPFDNPNPAYVINVQQGVLDQLEGTSHELAVCACDHDSPRLLDELKSFAERLKLFGMVLIPPFSDDERIPRLLTSIGCPYVRIASTPSEAAGRTILGQDRLGARAAGRHLLELGHSRIALIAGPGRFASSAQRQAGLEDALAERGLRLAASYLFVGAYTFESGEAAAERLLTLDPPPTAVFASNDEMAAGFLSGARRLGLTAPHDFSLVGFDDLAIARLTSPPLTTVRMPSRDFGRRAAELLVGDNRPDSPASATADPAPTLIRRGSCTRLSAALTNP